MEERSPLLEAQSPKRADDEEKKQIDFAKFVCIVCNQEMLFGLQRLSTLGCQGGHIVHNGCLDVKHIWCPLCEEDTSITGSIVVFKGKSSSEKVKLPKPKNFESSKHRKIKWWCCK